METCLSLRLLKRLYRAYCKHIVHSANSRVEAVFSGASNPRRLGAAGAPAAVIKRVARDAPATDSMSPIVRPQPGHGPR
ncbi:hypothetical protein BQ8482_160086 [Mesorhizobium delmotii]|uniref:Uncharacterized protein n=1 Tax=Mesorhizobium delmotii TaxID=1631247 RepID=A0A2P9AHL1_9HYPH|nr:hypothetical protein BQ8482_160086 [Mesorhizobium delmotii]